MMKKALTLAAIAEAVTGLALLLVPSLIGLALFGEELTGVGILSGRVTGIALIALSIACWPGPPFAGMLIYSAAVASYFAYVGFVNGLTGLLLWPAVVLHLLWWLSWCRHGNLKHDDDTITVVISEALAVAIELARTNWFEALHRSLPTLAKLMKRADKTSNLRAIAFSPPPTWR